MTAMRGLSLDWRAGVLASILLIPLTACVAEPDAPADEARLKSSPATAASDAATVKSPAAEAPADQAPVKSPASASAPRGYPGPLPPLPNVPYAPARPIEVTRAVYAFAARNPDVLSYVPCFCGCEHHGHQGNDDCFVASRDSDGKPRWEMHGYV
jgi:hypothetical protein